MPTTTDDTTQAPVVVAPSPRPASLVMLRGEGRVTVARRDATLAMCRLTGAIEHVHVEWLLAELDRQITAGVTMVFVDASRSTTLSTSARRTLGAWSMQHDPRLHAVHVLGDAATLDEPLETLAHALGERLHRYHQAEPFSTALEGLRSA